jgi:hypothetical protein
MGSWLSVPLLNLISGLVKAWCLKGQGVLVTVTAATAQPLQPEMGSTAPTRREEATLGQCLWAHFTDGNPKACQDWGSWDSNPGAIQAP